MKKKLNVSGAVILFLMLIFILHHNTYAQTEGFNVKTPIEKIADSTSNFLKKIVDHSAQEPEKSIPQDLVCNSKCILVIPEIDVVQSRGDFVGTGLFACRVPNSGKFTEPLFYQIDNLKSFEESGGGLLIFVTNQSGMKAILGDDIHLGSDNTSAGPIGDTKSGEIKSFTAYAKYSDTTLSGMDLRGSVLEYSSKDTFNAYQGTVVPIDIFVDPQDVPPVLRDFDYLLSEWTKNCK